MDKLSWNNCGSFQRLLYGMPPIHIDILYHSEKSVDFQYVWSFLLFQYILLHEMEKEGSGGITYDNKGSGTAVSSDPGYPALL